MKLPKLIAILDNPLANPPGHTIKEERQPCVPVAAIAMNECASEKVKEKSRALARAMAAAPDLLAALHRLVDAVQEYDAGFCDAEMAAARKAIEKAEGAELP
jgi:aminoglycoside phosphotransferase (APT) family kinase protein